MRSIFRVGGSVESIAPAFTTSPYPTRVARRPPHKGEVQKKTSPAIVPTKSGAILRIGIAAEDARA
jgi:hypothetical protein